MALIDEHLHAEGEGYLHHFATDISSADDTEHLAVDFEMWHEEVVGEVAAIALCQHPNLCLHGAGEIEEHHDGSVRHTLGTVGGDVADGDALGTGGFDIDIVEAGASLDDEFEAVGELADEFTGNGQFLGHNGGGALYARQELIGGGGVIDCGVGRKGAEVHAAVVVHLGSVQYYGFLIHDL